MNVDPIKKSKSPKHLLINLGAIFTLALVITLLYFDNWDNGPKYFIVSYGWALAICITQWLGNAYIYAFLDRKISWHEHLVKRAIVGSLAIIGYSVLAYVAVQFLMFWLVQGGLPERALYWAVRSSYVAIIISFIVSLVFVAIGFFRNWRASVQEAEGIKAEMLMYKYESLQNQINPHFLFNSFNVLSELVYENQDKAVNFIGQMSQLFRYVLDSRDKELVSITEELEFIESYTYLLQTRFEEKLSIVREFEPGEDEMIVPMTLQLLIENCVKHNEISAAQPLVIQIIRKGDYLEVNNRFQPKAVGPDSKKTGLSNIAQQFSYFTKKEIIISETDQTFSVAVPIIKASKS